MVPMHMRPESVQRMMLTPEMLLSMHVLQLNITDLRMFMRAELEENPLLEEEEQEVSLSEDEIKLDEEFSMLIDEDFEGRDLHLDLDERPYNISEGKRCYLESLIIKKESLYEHLHWQLEILAKNDEEKRIGEFIIGNLDDNGFLNMDLGRMREKIGADIESFKRALSLVRSFDPIGVGARNTEESLLIQLIFSGKGDTHLYRIVYSYLEDLEKGNYERIARALSVSLKEVKKAKKRISYLNPRPGAAFGGEEARRIEPDVFLSKNNGSYDAQVNERCLPRLGINRFYKSILREKKAPEETKEYIKKKLINARWVIDAVRQRTNTVTRVCEYLSEAQKGFLESGDLAAKPLTLKQAASALFVSEATVSRVVSNKYAHIPNRLFALKDFFAGAIKTMGGNVVSDRSIKQRIQNFIEQEDVESPLSDERITSALKKEGVNIARRTVAKYRESLKILPFNLRRKHR